MDDKAKIHKCSECGSSLQISYKFCPFCSHPVDVGNTPTTSSDKTPSIDSLSSFLSGSELYALERWQEAIEAYTEAIQRDPSDAKLYLGRAWAHEALKWNPGPEQEELNQANIYDTTFWDEQCQKEEDDYTEAIRLNPDYAEAYYSRSVMYEEQGSDEKAYDDLTQLIRLEPDNADHYSRRAALLPRLRKL